MKKLILFIALTLCFAWDVTGQWHGTLRVSGIVIQLAFYISGRDSTFSYPLYFLIAMSTVWSVWNEQTGGELSAVAGIIVAVATLVIFYFSDRIYQWDVRLMYGRVFRKLERTIAEMEKLKQG